MFCICKMKLYLKSSVFLFFAFFMSSLVCSQDFVYKGNAAPAVMPTIKTLHEDLWVRQLNFGFFSLLYSKNEDYHVSELENELRAIEAQFLKSPISVELKVASLGDSLRGFNFDVTYKGELLSKLLASRSNILRLRATSKIVGCDEEIATGKLINESVGTKELVRALRNTRYAHVLPFRCDFLVEKIFIGDAAINNKSTDVMELIFANSGRNLISNSFIVKPQNRTIYSRYGAAQKQSSTANSNVLISIYNDGSLSVRSSFTAKVRLEVLDDKDFYENTTHTFYSFKLDSEFDFDSSLIPGENESSKLVRLIDEYRESVVSSYVLEAGARAAFVRNKLESLRLPIKEAALELRESTESAPLISRIMVLKTINRAIEELSIAELKLELVHSAQDGISSLNIQNDLK